MMNKHEVAEDPESRVRFRLLLVDDHPVVLDGYRLMLDSQSDLEVCSAVANEGNALTAVVRDHPDLVIADLKMPGRGGLELIKDLVVLHPGVKILVCSMHDETLYAERALRAGAKGYLTKDSSGPVMLAAIRRVLGGGIYVSERIAPVCWTPLLSPGLGAPALPWKNSATGSSRSSDSSAKAKLPRK